MAAPFGVGGIGSPGSLSGVGGFGSFGGEKGSGKQFGDVLTEAIGRADQTAVDAEKSVDDLVSGKAVNSHDVMIRMEEAHLALQWTVQIRNRALEAYQEIMRMPL
jgi:flagellar hook-basal body complex protein FliE